MTKPKKKRVRLSREARYAAILSEARDVFVEMGYEDASMADVAERVGIVEGNIYRYFENKRDLLVKVIERFMEHALSDYDQHLAGISGVRNRLRFMIWHHLSILEQAPELSNLLVLHVRSSADYEDTVCYELNRRYTGHTESILKEGMAEGVFRQDVPVRLVRDMIYGGAEYHAWRYMTGRSDKLDVNATADQLCDLIFSALAFPVGAQAQVSSEVLARLSRLEENLAQGKKLEAKLTRAKKKK